MLFVGLKNLKETWDTSLRQKVEELTATIMLFWSIVDIVTAR